VVQPGLGGTGGSIVIGVDLGGTKIAVGLVTPAGRVHDTRTVTTPTAGGCPQPDASGTAIATLVNVLDPDVVVIGGGVAEAGLFLDDAVAGARRRPVAAVAAGWRLATAQRGGLAAVGGAGWLAMEHPAAR
jgi:predicted NBD/HSP70 family sugar kinase